MKKIKILLAIAVVMLCVLAGCSGSKKDTVVEVTMPASLFEDTSEEDIKAAAEEKGFQDCIINEDGTVTYKMTQEQKDEMLDEYKKSIEDTCKSLVEGEDAIESFTEISHNEDMTEFTIKVDSEKYSEWDSMSALAFYMSGAYYQIFNGVAQDDVDVVVNFTDKDTDEVLNSASYKEMMKSFEDDTTVTE